MAGRKAKLNDTVQQTVCDLLAQGVTDRDACNAVNISDHTFYNWLKWGEEQGEGSTYFQFFQAVTRARAEAKISAIETLRSGFKTQREIRETTTTVTETRLTKTGEPYEYTRSETIKTVVLHPPDWKAGAEYLKRRHPDEWSERQEITGKGGDAVKTDVNIDLSSLTIEQLKALVGEG